MGEGEFDERRLWQRSCDGDGEAFGLLFDRHQGRVHRHACRLVDTRHDAEDVTAAAFLELWRRRSAVRLANGSTLPWLLVTATNVSRNLARSTRRYRDFLARLPRVPVAPDTADVAFGSGALGVDPQLRQSLAALKGTDLELVVLVALEDYTLADAAALLGLTPAATKSRYHRARTQLRASLDDSFLRDASSTTGGES
jgi:RNA polymerase sigma-70 factor (ECF subfamily)